MCRRRLRLAAVVLAAGAGSRYSDQPGAKLLADLDGQPLLAHALGAVREFGPAATVVVLGHGADKIERRIAWSDEIRVLNPTPERGLGSSLQVGIAALEVLSDDADDADRSEPPDDADDADRSEPPGGADGAFVVLGDQPRLRADVMRALADAAVTARPADRPIVVPRYAAEAGPRNPALLLRPAWQFIADIDPERGLAPLIEQHPDMVQTVAVPGTMPDVDGPADLDELRLPRDGP